MWERKQALERELPGKRAPGEIRVQLELEGEQVQLRRGGKEGEHGAGGESRGAGARGEGKPWDP